MTVFVSIIPVTSSGSIADHQNSLARTQILRGLGVALLLWLESGFGSGIVVEVRDLDPNARLLPHGGGRRTVLLD